jgi:hypothetical protein
LHYSLTLKMVAICSPKPDDTALHPTRQNLYCSSLKYNSRFHVLLKSKRCQIVHAEYSQLRIIVVRKNCFVSNGHRPYWPQSPRYVIGFCFSSSEILGSGPTLFCVSKGLATGSGQGSHQLFVTKIQTSGKRYPMSCLHLQCRTRTDMSKWNAKPAQTVHLAIEEKCWTVRLSLLATVQHLYSLALFLPPWRWRWNGPTKGRFIISPHGSTSQKTTFFIVTTVKISNPTIIMIIIIVITN